MEIMLTSPPLADHKASRFMGIFGKETVAFCFQVCATTRIRVTLGMVGTVPLVVLDTGAWIG